MAEKLEKSIRAQEVVKLPGWKDAEDRDAITKTFVSSDFNAAFGFMARVALLAEKLDHHPEWINIYRKVEVTLTTHSVGGVTDLDIMLARKMDEIAES